MTAAELIAELEKLPGDTEIVCVDGYVNSVTYVAGRGHLWLEAGPPPQTLGNPVTVTFAEPIP